MTRSVASDNEERDKTPLAFERPAPVDRVTERVMNDSPAEELPEVGLSAESRSRLHWFVGTADTTSQDPGSLSYEPYFELHEKPFSLSSDPRFFFSRSVHGSAFDTLAAGIRRREGILVLTGEVGTGKTTLCRAVVESLDQKTFASFVPDPFLTREDLLKTLLVDFGVVSVDEIKSGRLRGASRTELSYPLYDFLISLQPLKAFAVVLIDEAQNLSPELLEEVRILSDLDKGQKLLEVVLIGQPELQSRLAAKELRQLSQRVSIRCELLPLTRGEVPPYITHRLLIAGNDGRVQFSASAIDIIHSASNGTPRLINLVCDRALLRAARLRTTRIEPEHVVCAIHDLKLPAADTFQAPPQVRAPVEPEVWKPQPPQPVRSAAVREEPTADPFASFLRESRQASTERDAPVEPTRAETPDTIPEAVASIPLALGRRSKLPPLDLSSPPVQSHADESRDNVFPTAVARHMALEAEASAAKQGRRRQFAAIAACLALVAGLGYWYSTTRPRSAPAARQNAPAAAVAQPAPAEPAPPAANAPAAVKEPASPAGEAAGAASRTVAPDPSAKGFAVQMATFRSTVGAQQALKEFRDAGYDAFSAERTLRDGGHAIAVLLGPYPERSEAEQDRELAKELPGYGTGIVVQLGQD